MATIRDPRAPVIKRDGSATRHELAIRMLINSHPLIRRNGFRAAVRDLWERLTKNAEWPEDVPAMPFLPDAYMIDEESETLVLYEVEDSNPISPRKLADLGWFWFEWDAEDCHEWLPKLMLVDRYGRVTGEINMCALYYAAHIDCHRPSPLSLSPGEGG